MYLYPNQMVPIFSDVWFKKNVASTALEIELMGVKNFSQWDFGVVRRINFRARIEHLQSFHNSIQLFLFDHVDLVENDYIGELNLVDHQMNNSSVVVFVVDRKPVEEKISFNWAG